MSKRNETPIILIVDDQTANLDVLRGILKSNYKILATTSGKQALKIAQHKQPDLILLDIMMPELDGYQVCKALKDNPSTAKIPVIFITAMIEHENEFTGLELGAVDYLTKPVNADIVKQRIKNHLELYDRRRQLESEVEKRTAKIEASRMEIIHRLGRAAEYKDNETGLHVKRMSLFSHKIALETGMTEREARLILKAAPMHDIGKIGIPDSILLKPGKLDSEEWEVMQTHAQIGADILSDGDSAILKLAETIAITHHEKWDGSGYPNGLAGEDIPLAGRIVAIADVFDALTSERPYKKAWPTEKAVNLIKEESGKHFDPSLVLVFLSVLDEIIDIKEKLKDTF